MKKNQITILIIEILYLLLYSICNFAVIFPGEPMPLRFKVMVATFSLVNFGICILWRRRGILTNNLGYVLLGIAIFFLFTYFAGGIKTLMHYGSSQSTAGWERIKSLLLCMEEVSFRMLCLVPKRKHITSGL